MHMLVKIEKKTQFILFYRDFGREKGNLYFDFTNRSFEPGDAKPRSIWQIFVNYI